MKVSEATASKRRIVVKLVFVLFRRSDFSHEQSMAQWNGEQHTSTVRIIPGFRKWV